MTVYLRYLALNLVMTAALVGAIVGGVWMGLGLLLALGIAVGGDLIFGDDLSTPKIAHPWLLNLELALTLPLLLALSITFAWYLGEGDALGLGAAVQQLTGYDMVAAREATQFWHLLLGGLGLGLIYGGGGTNVGHEFVHRTWSKPAQILGRWMLAFTCDASFAIEHVYGHHRNVATFKDPASARRGENAWAFVVRSTVFGYLSAWRLEAERLARRGHSVWSWRNRMHRGNFMSLTYAALFGVFAGWLGVAVFFVVALYGKAYLELINYVEHYGLVRVPDAAVEPRHSWNCNRRVSSWLLFNLTRHSHHHAAGEKPFWELRPMADMPMLPQGYLTMLLLAAVPPLWHWVMTPRVLAWDREFASAEELPLIAEANRKSGRPEFFSAAQAAAA